MKQLTREELDHWEQTGKRFHLVDVREPWEHDAYNIGGVLIPLGQIMRRTSEIPTAEPVVMYCKKGIRSQIAIQRLQSDGGFQELYNLVGGIGHRPG